MLAYCGRPSAGRRGVSTEVRQQNGDRTAEFRERGAHRAVFGAVGACGRQAGLGGFGELELLGEPLVEALGSGATFAAGALPASMLPPSLRARPCVADAALASTPAPCV